jgi:hypothetical protein
MKRALILLVAVLAAVLVTAATKPHPRFDSNLPVLGTKFHSLPAGKGKNLVEAICFPCHSADILVQQRLSEKQWSAAVDKMIRWGAVVKDRDKPVILAYLVKHFGPENKFTPIRTRPAGY